MKGKNVGLLLLAVFLIATASKAPMLLILVVGIVACVPLWKMIPGPAKGRRRLDLAEIGREQEEQKVSWPQQSPVSARPATTCRPQEMAKGWLESNALILDTETTGLDDAAEIVDIAVIDCSGRILLDTLLKPTRPIPLEAQHIHGITDAMVAAAPTWADIHDRFCQIMQGRPVLVYNRDYDHRLLRQTMAQHNLPPPDLGRMECAMLAYAEHQGEWNSYRGSYRWHTLVNAAKQQGVLVEGAHRAKGDCLMTLGVIKAMAEPPILPVRKRKEQGEPKWAKLKRLKQEEKLEEAEKFLIELVQLTEEDDKDGVSPWCYEQLAIIYRKQKRRHDEAEILRRYSIQKKAPGASQEKLAERLVKVEAQLNKQNKEKRNTQSGA